MLGARNEAVRGHAAVLGKMEVMYYQYGGKEERVLNGKDILCSGLERGNEHNMDDSGG